jgi:uncharacterized protein YdaU (DUF1376 family)
VEDAAYSRLIRKYYAQEKPLPVELKAVQRLVGARTKEEREAVEAVLSEFFHLLDDGWHNTRCDEEIARYQGKQAKAKASADARWNKQRSQSEGNANASADAMRTHSEGNAHQTPDTNHQSPDPNHRVNTASDDSQVGSAGTVQAGPTPTAGEISIVMRRAGVMSQPADPRLMALAEQGVSLETVKFACEEARRAKPNAPVGPGYVVAIIDRLGREARELNVAGARPPAASTPRAAAHAGAMNSIGLGGHHDQQPVTIDAATGRVSD